MTLRYQHLSPEHLRDAVRALGRRRTTETHRAGADTWSGAISAPSWSAERVSNGGPNGIRTREWVRPRFR